MAANAYRGKSFADNKPCAKKSGGTMPTPSRDTWADWFDDADSQHQVTLEGLFERYPLAIEGVTPDKVRYWQKAGVLPQPVKRWHDGATRALYPAMYTYLAIAEIRQLQERGYTLQQIKERIRRRVVAWSNKFVMLERWQARALAMADEYTEITGNAISSVQIEFIDSDGEKDGYHYDASALRSEWE